MKKILLLSTFLFPTFAFALTYSFGYLVMVFYLDILIPFVILISVFSIIFNLVKRSRSEKGSEKRKEYTKTIKRSFIVFIVLSISWFLVYLLYLGIYEDRFSNQQEIPGVVIVSE